MEIKNQDLPATPREGFNDLSTLLRPSGNFSCDVTANSASPKGYRYAWLAATGRDRENLVAAG